MRVLHIFDHSAPLQSGYVTRSLGILRAQRGHGVEVAALTTPRHGAEAGPPATPSEEVAGFTFHRTPAPPEGRLPGFLREMKATAARIAEVAEEFRPDVLHAHSPSLNAFPAVRAARALGIPVVYEIRAFWEDAAVDRGVTTEGSIRYRLTRAMESRAIKKVDHVFAICQGLCDDLRARGLPAERLNLAPNAVELDRLTPIAGRDAALSAKLALGEGPILGFVGSFYRYEGLDLLMKAFPAIRARHPQARLLMVGGGPEDERLRAMAVELGEAVIFTGRVPPEAVPAHYSLIDLLVYPRMRMRLTDLVTPLKPLEAMAQQRAFIASDVGGHRELVRHGETGHLFPADNAKALAEAAIAALALPASERAAMSAHALEFVQRERSWAAVGARYLPVYERLQSVALSLGHGKS